MEQSIETGGAAMSSQKKPTSKPEPQAPLKPGPSEMLTEAEVLELRRIGKEQSAFAKGAFSKKV